MGRLLNISLNIKDFLIVLSFIILAVINELNWFNKINNYDNYFFIITVAVIFGFLIGIAYIVNINIVIRKLFKTRAESIFRKIYLINLPLYLLCLYPFKIHIFGNSTLNKLLILIIPLLIVIIIIFILLYTNKNKIKEKE